MTHERWPRVKELFHAALERAPADRSDFLAEQCGLDESLRVEVERLLGAHEEAGSFIEASPVAGLARAVQPATETLTGRVVAHYEIQRLIGVGGMGKVYAAHDTRLERIVAVKVVHGGSRDGQGALHYEARQASKLNHPHICTVHEVGAFEGQAYIVMEYVEGRPLDELIGAAGVPLSKAVRYGIQIADALAHAHRHGVIHRDLKSANVVVTPDGRAKVLDFGLARGNVPARAGQDPQSDGTRPAEEAIAGTLAYMAPELLRGGVADECTDIWALGVVLFELAAGHLPFAAKTGGELRAAILDTLPARLSPTAAAGLDAVIQRCLAQDRHDRYQHASEVHAALEAVDAVLDRPPLHDPSSILISAIFNGPLTRDGAARVAGARGDFTGAIGTYRGLLAVAPGQKWVGAFEPRYVLELARLLTKAGQKDAARQEYRRFLELWKDADPGLPEVAEARRAL